MNKKISTGEKDATIGEPSHVQVLNQPKEGNGSIAIFILKHCTVHSRKKGWTKLQSIGPPQTHRVGCRVGAPFSYSGISPYVIIITGLLGDRLHWGGSIMIQSGCHDGQIRRRTNNIWPGRFCSPFSFCIYIRNPVDPSDQIGGAPRNRSLLPWYREILQTHICI